MFYQNDKNEEIFISCLIFVGEMAKAPAQQASQPAAAHPAPVQSGLGSEKRPQTASRPRETILQCGPSTSGGLPGLNLQCLPHDTFDDEIDEGNFSNEKTIYIYIYKQE